MEFSSSVFLGLLSIYSLILGKIDCGIYHHTPPPKVRGEISKRICKRGEGWVQKCLEGTGVRSLYLTLLLYSSLENFF